MRSLSHALFICGVLGAVACGGGGGALPNSNLNSPEAYNQWMSDVLTAQKDVVSDSTAAFVPYENAISSNLLTDIKIYARVEGEAIDKLRRFSSTPEIVDQKLIDGINDLPTAGRSLTIDNKFSSSGSNSINIPILKSVLSFTRDKSISSEFKVAISYEKANTSWISPIALKDLLKNGGFSQEFLDNVNAGKVSIFRGSISLHNVKIVLSNLETGTINVGDTFNGSNGLIIKVTQKSEASTTGSITLETVGDLVVGIDEYRLGPTDLGRLASTQDLTWGSANVNHKINFDQATGIGVAELKNNSTHELQWLNVYTLAKYSDGSGKTLADCRVSSYHDILPNAVKTENIQWTGIPFRSELASYVGGGFSYGTSGELNYSGSYKGALARIDGDPVGGGLGSSGISVVGFIASNGSVHFWNKDTREILIEGEVKPDSSFTFSTPFGVKSGTMTIGQDTGSPRQFYLADTPYELRVTQDFGPSSP